MANHKKTSRRKQGKPASGKNRHQLVLAAETTKKADEIAKVEHRSFNNTVEVLILKEHARLFPSAQEKAVAA